MYDYDKAAELEACIEALNVGNAKLIEAGALTQPESPEQLDLEALKRTLRNQVLAGSAVKAAFFGTLSTAPTVTATWLTARGVTAAAATAIIAERDRIRAALLALVT